MPPAGSAPGVVTLGLDLGGTKIAAALVRDGVILQSLRVDTPQTGFDAVISALHAAAAKLILAADVGMVGIGCPGPLDLKRGRVRFAPNIAGFEDVPLVEALEAKLQRPVVLENDANAAGYAEHRYGAGRDLRSSVYVTLSTGIGGGIFLGDEVVQGAHSMAGEIGHMVVLPGGPVGGDGHGGTWEGLAAGRALSRDASHVFGRPMRTEELFELAEGGERKALAIVHQAAEISGIGFANIAKMFDPDGFVVGGGLATSGPFYISKVRAAYERAMVGYPAPLFRLAELGGEAGVIGAAAVAAQRLRDGA
jgi:glucokinase